MPPRPRSRLFTVPGMTTGRFPRARSTPAKPNPSPPCARSHEETGYAAHLGRRLAAVSYPVEQDIKKVRYWAARAIGGEFTPERRGRRTRSGCPWPKPMNGCQLPARPKSATPLHKAPGRHEDGADRPARHRGQQVPIQGRRPEASARQARSRPGRVAGRTAAGFRCRRALRRRPDCAAGRRSSRWPRSSACHHPQRAAADRGGLCRRPEGRPATRVLEIAGRRWHAGDLHTGQGDSRSHRVVV